MLYNKKRLILSFIIVLIVILIGTFSLEFFSSKKIPQQQRVTHKLDSNLPHEPVYLIDGKIEGIGDKSITISIISVNFANKRQFIVNTTPNTVITSSTPAFLLNSKAFESLPKPITLKDLKIGQTAQIVSNEDLSSLRSNNFEAKSITLFIPTYVLNSQVKNVSATSISVTVVSVNAIDTRDVIVPKDFSVTFSQDTIFSKTDSGAEPISITSSVIKPGDHLIVYTDSDIRSTQTVRGLKINLLPQ